MPHILLWDFYHKTGGEASYSYYKSTIHSFLHKHSNKVNPFLLCRELFRLHDSKERAKRIHQHTLVHYWAGTHSLFCSSPDPLWCILLLLLLPDTDKYASIRPAKKKKNQSNIICQSENFGPKIRWRKKTNDSKGPGFHTGRGWRGNRNTCICSHFGPFCFFPNQPILHTPPQGFYWLCGKFSNTAMITIDLWCSSQWLNKYKLLLVCYTLYARILLIKGNLYSFLALE